jgi:hypothetical protein
VKNCAEGGETARLATVRGKTGMEDDWDVARNDRGWPFGATGMGILRITLLFGSGAVALALIIAPLAESQTRSHAEGDRTFGLDDVETGSVRKGGEIYTIHKSVLQSSPDAICVIKSNGRRIGDC